MKQLEENLFEKIQCMVENLPWDHKTNLSYYQSCVHEAAHAVVSLWIYKTFNNPEDLVQLTLEVEGPRGGTALRKHGNGNFWLLSVIPVFIDKLRQLSGAILSDEYFAYFYKFKRILWDSWELMKEYGAWSDIKKAEHKGVIGAYIDRLILRLSYQNRAVRLLHLWLIYDLLKRNGLFVIKDPMKYLKEREL